MATYINIDRQYTVTRAGSVRELFEQIKDHGNKIKLTKERELPAEKEGDEPTKITEIALDVKALRSELKGDVTELEIYKDGEDEWTRKVFVFH